MFFRKKYKYYFGSYLAQNNITGENSKGHFVFREEKKFENPHEMIKDMMKNVIKKALEDNPSWIKDDVVCVLGSVNYIGRGK